MDRLIYPNEQCLQGTTVLGFTVDTLGNVVNPVIKRSLSGLVDEQLLKEIIKHKFVPGKLGDQVSEMSVILPFRITVE